MQSAYEATLKALDHRPLDQVFWRMFKDSRRWSRDAARRLWGTYREERRQTPRAERGPDNIGDALARSQSEDQEMEALVDDIGNTIWLQGDYLDKLRDAFDHHLREARKDAQNKALEETSAPSKED